VGYYGTAFHIMGYAQPEKRILVGSECVVGSLQDQLRLRVFDRVAKTVVLATRLVNDGWQPDPTLWIDGGGRAQDSKSVTDLSLR
jgi:hypothetical protein